MVVIGVELCPDRSQATSTEQYMQNGEGVARFTLHDTPICDAVMTLWAQLKPKAGLYTDI